MKQALILFAHGSRDAIWAEPFYRLRDMVRELQPGLPAELAFLELMQPGLEDQVKAFVAQGVTEIRIVPIFFGRGGHLLRDLPRMADALRAAHPGVAICVADAVGEDEGVLRAIALCCAGLPGKSS